MRREVLNEIRAWMGSRCSCFSVGVMRSMSYNIYMYSRIRITVKSVFLIKDGNLVDLTNFCVRLVKPIRACIELTESKKPQLVMCARVLMRVWRQKEDILNTKIGKL